MKINPGQTILFIDSLNGFINLLNNRVVVSECRPRNPISQLSNILWDKKRAILWRCSFMSSVEKRPLMEWMSLSLSSWLSLFVPMSATSSYI